MIDNVVISVIIPFYNGKDYIDRCIKSILEQDYQNIEILLINDGSPTGGDVCEQIARENVQIRYFEKANEGIGATRNFGLMHAKGDYLAFLDQDDVWARGFLDNETVLAISDYDITAFSYILTNQDFTRGNRVNLETCQIIGGGINAVRRSWLHHSCMMYSREFLMNNRIEYALTRHEDCIFVHRATYLSKRIQHLDKTMFLYRNNPASETHRNQRPEELYIPLLQSWMGLQIWHQAEHIDDEEIIRFIKHMICVYAIEGLESLYQSGRSERTLHDIAKKQFEQYLVNYQEDTATAPWQVERIAQYFDNYKQFVRENWLKGKRRSIEKLFVQFPFVRKVYERMKYHEDLPASICVK